MSDKDAEPGPSRSKKESAAMESARQEQDGFCGLYYINTSEAVNSGRKNKVVKERALSVIDLQKSSFTVNVRNILAEVNFQQVYRAPNGYSDCESFFLISKKFEDLNLFHLNVKCSSWELKMDIKSLEMTQKEFAASMGSFSQEDDETTKESFKIRIGFLKPSQSITVEMYFVTTLRSIGESTDNGLMGLRIPISLAAAVPTTPCRLKEVPINGALKIESKTEIINVFCPSHPECFRKEFNLNASGSVSSPANAFFNNYEIPTTSLEFTIQFKAPTEPSVLIEEVEINGLKSVAVMVHVIPNIRSYKGLKKRYEKLDAVVVWKDNKGFMIEVEDSSIIQIPTVIEDYHSCQSLEFVAILDEPEQFPELMEIVVQTQERTQICRFKVKLSEAMTLKANYPGLVHRYAMSSIMKEKDASPKRRELGLQGALKFGVVVEGTTVVPVHKDGRGICFNWILPKPVVAQSIGNVGEEKDNVDVDGDSSKGVPQRRGTRRIKSKQMNA